MRTPLPAILVLLLSLLPAPLRADEYQLRYLATVEPDTGMANVEVRLRGERLPSKLVLQLDPERHLGPHSETGLTLEGDKAIWSPEGPNASLHYQFVINEQKASGRYDSLITGDWAILRSDKLIPPIATTVAADLEAVASLEFTLPQTWSSAAPYPDIAGAAHHYRIIDPGRRLPRPKGWLILGDISSRQDSIAGVSVRVAAPAGPGNRLQDTLAFLAWTLPEVKSIFPDFPERLLVVTAGDPMWRGGLSGTRSLFMHAERPLISGNRTSSLIHELIHVASGISGGKNADWIVEGLAEYYASNILWRSGAVSDHRYREALAWKKGWAREAETLFVSRSSGPVTARAAIVMQRLDAALGKATAGKAGIDDIARQLATKGGKVSLDQLRCIVHTLAGTDVDLDAIIAGT
ncbi:hypothetical protein CWI75_06360 [Kineobactrum sediminis]|uniref:Peptidase M61 catalytic domain-containing protein n=1 Tax=Kineobactrum sediminis TaxID=1905677 RepID=A0A2N5Y3S1_9GAMM|nr:hypothetical protein [Kineobactrum sediminis]PLW83044.1 hypothetical protein CWI75_06360 [Kineobactrum sediminis]